MLIILYHVWTSLYTWKEISYKKFLVHLLLATIAATLNLGKTSTLSHVGRSEKLHLSFIQFLK